MLQQFIIVCEHFPLIETVKSI